MAKKKVIKKKSAKKSYHAKPKTSKKEDHVLKTLSENTVALQKVMTHLAVKLDKLSNQISDLLKLFEESAKTLAEKEFDKETNTKDLKEISEKMEQLMDQNKTIAKGLTLFGEKNPESPRTIPQQNIVPPRPIRQLPQMNQRDHHNRLQNNGLQKSIMSQDKEEELEEQNDTPFPENENQEIDQNENQFQEENQEYPQEEQPQNYGNTESTQDINQYNKPVSTRPEKTFNQKQQGGM